MGSEMQHGTQDRTDMGAKRQRWRWRRSMQSSVISESVHERKYRRRKEGCTAKSPCEGAERGLTQRSDSCEDSRHISERAHI